MNYYKRHLGDYATKAGHLSALEHGVYNLLIDSYYSREEAPTKAEAMRVARARSADEMAAVEIVLGEFFTEVDGRYTHGRIEEELEVFRGKQEVNRQLGAKGGVAKAKRIASETLSESVAKQDSNQLANAYPSHKPVASSQEKTKTTAAPTGADSLFSGIAPQVIADFTKLRQSKKAPITQTAVDGIRREAAKAGLSLQDALTMCCERGWTGFKAEWVAGAGQVAASVPGGGRRAL